MQYDLFSKPNFKFFCLGSGSSGNCYYLGTKEYGILIDAGIGIRTVRKSLHEYGVSLDKILGVLITHDHNDHIKTVGCFGDKYNIPIYATRAVHEAIYRSRYVEAQLTTSRRIIEKETPFILKDFTITAFDVPHDSMDNSGYLIEFDGQAFVLITDVGRVTQTIVNYASLANHLVVEANYDEEMLQNGRYPFHLKKRITSGTGHLSNRLSAELLSYIYTDKLKNIWLCHLSQDNNRPEVAHETIRCALAKKGADVGKDVKLEVLSRYKASGLREL